MSQMAFARRASSPKEMEHIAKREPLEPTDSQRSTRGRCIIRQYSSTELEPMAIGIAPNANQRQHWQLLYQLQYR